jgi:hypothetical protein
MGCISLGLACVGVVGWKLFLNGRLDELAYDIGAFDRSLPFPVLKEKSRINERAKAADGDPQFSRRIREGLPGMSPR